MNNNAESTLSGYLQSAALMTDLDDAPEGGVSIATVHSAKGLEFDNVFIVGMEENIFPLSRIDSSSDNLEEERRLLYVALTRAKKELTITRAKIRFMYGDIISAAPSRFLNEVAGLEVADEKLDELRGVV